MRKDPLSNPESMGGAVSPRDLIAQFELHDPSRKDPSRDPADSEPEGGVAPPGTCSNNNIGS